MAKMYVGTEEVQEVEQERPRTEVERNRLLCRSFVCSRGHAGVLACGLHTCSLATPEMPCVYEMCIDICVDMCVDTSVWLLPPSQN